MGGASQAANDVEPYKKIETVDVNNQIEPNQPTAQPVAQQQPVYNVGNPDMSGQLGGVEGMEAPPQQTTQMQQLMDYLSKARGGK